MDKPSTSANNGATELTVTATFRISPPEAFSFATPNEWPAWKKRFKRFHSASGLASQPSSHQVDALIYIMGPQAEDVLQTFKLSDTEAQDFEKVMENFERYFIPRRNVVYERAMINTRSQLETETVEEYVTALHGLATTCNYGPLKEELVRDRLIVGLRDSMTSEKLQLDPDLDLQKAIAAARQSEVIKKQQVELRPTKEKDASVDRIAAKNGTAAGPAQQGTECSNVRTPTKKTATPKPKGKPCRWCGREAHPRSVCPTKNAGCSRCKKKGHFATVCKSSTTVNSLVHEQGFVGVAASPQTAKWDIEIFVDETPVVFRIDTGADETV
ncbi:uncharacterized protein ISCGN_004552 [Ixodes scapularis]